MPADTIPGCGACTEVINQSDQKLCSECKQGYHYQCLDITSENFKRESKTYKSSWKCPQCKPKDKRRERNSEVHEDNTGTPKQGVGCVHKKEELNLDRKDMQTMESLMDNLKSYIEERLLVVKKDLVAEMDKSFGDHIKPINQNITSIEESIKTLEKRYDQMITTVNKFEQDMKSIYQQQENIQQENSTLKNQLSLLEAKLEGIEDRSRSCNVEIRGLPETEGED
ncbi:hypothetical protein O0L34_g19106 [Tuta absoluta]|nr:hypothetical protein O0L34_g19106 [Tuta absoluta]